MNRGKVAELDVGSPLSCLCISPDIQHCAVGTRDAVKIFGIGPVGFEEIKTLNVSTRGNVKFSITDVKWSGINTGLIGASMNNGGVVVWDLNQINKKDASQAVNCYCERVMVEHQRTVNRISWHPTEASLLLTCSMDGTMKLWDRRGRSHHCVITFHPRSDAVRDVEFSPFQPHRLAAVFDNGQLQVWDKRKAALPELKLMAHSQAINALNWHPMKDWEIATGSKDRTVCIWDLESCTLGDTRAQTSAPITMVHCPAPVGRVKWRPGHTRQILVSALAVDADVCVYDVTQPFIPLAVLEGNEDPCTGVEWIDTPLNREPMGGGRDISPLAITSSNPHLRKPWELDCAPLLDISRGRTKGSASPGGWTGGWNWAGQGGVSIRNVFGGVWQHAVTCSKDGYIRMHSMLRCYRPRDHISPCVFDINLAGGLAQVHDDVSWVPETYGFYRDEVTDAGLGMFREAFHCTSVSTPLHNQKRSSKPPGSVRKSSAVVWGPLGSPSKNRELTEESEDASNFYEEAKTLSNSSPTFHEKALVTLSDCTLSTLEKEYATFPESNPQPRSLIDIVTLHGQDGFFLKNSIENDSEMLRVLAEGYRLRGGSIRELCGHNSELAATYGMLQIASAWRIIQILLDGTPPELLVTTYDKKGNSSSAEPMKQELICTGNDNVQGDFSMPEALASLEDQHNSPDKSCLSPIMTTKHDKESSTSKGGPISWLWRTVLADFVQERAEQGDILHCVTACEVIREWYTHQFQAGPESVQIDQNHLNPAVHDSGQFDSNENWCGLSGLSSLLVREWYDSYIELLRKLGLHLIATEVTRNSLDPWICMKNMQGTVIHTNCSKCRAPSGPTTRCEKCLGALSRCALCQQPVRGLYVWCPGCSHGGHLSHMKSWFSNESVCPTGCGHRCNLTSQ